MTAFATTIKEGIVKKIDDGHTFEMENVQDGIQTVKFMRRTAGEMVHDGTTNEEVLRMMIARMQYLQGKLACRENAIVITKLEEALMWLESRTKKRVEQKVETLDIAHK